jgi:chemotaxis protein histidine kinase CheA
MLIKMKGDISVESEKGKGSKFTLLIDSKVRLLMIIVKVELDVISSKLK